MKIKAVLGVMLTLIIMATNTSLTRISVQSTSTQSWTTAFYNPQRTSSTPKIGSMIEPALLWSYAANDHIWSPPTIGDVDGDGLMEVLFGSNDFFLYCLSGDNGALKWRYETGSDIENTPTLADVDLDGEMEVFFGSYDMYFYSLRSNGTLMWRYLTGGRMELGSSLVDDVDGDGDAEAIIANGDGNVYCWKATDGTLEWVSAIGTNCWATPAVADIDRDGDKEVLVGGGGHHGDIYCLKSNGTTKWNYYVGEQVYGITLEDIDGNGLLEILATDDDGTIYCLNSDGMLRWTYAIAGEIPAYPGHVAVADIDQDSCMEVVVMLQVYIVCLTHEGVVEWDHCVADGEVHPPTLGDFDNDELMEVLFGCEDYNIYLVEHDGTMKWKYTTSDDAGANGVSSEDVNGDGLVELFAPCSDGYLYCITGLTTIETPIKGGENATIEGNVTITNVLVTKNTLHFDASGPSGLTGWINVTFPMVNTTDIKVFINKEKLTPPPFPIITTNGTHYFIYFEFTLSTHSIDIQFGPTEPVGGIYIPVNKLELLAPYIGSTILLAVAVMTVGYVKKRKGKLK